MITGQENPDGGSIKVGETVQIAYVDQDRVLEGKRTVYDEVSGGQDTIDIGKRSINSRAYLASLGFKGPDQQKLVANLSGGERNRLHLAKLLKSGGNLILLDEPTNDLDVDTLRAWRKRCLGSRDVRWSSRTTGGFSTVSRRTFWRSRDTARSSGLRETFASTMLTTIAAKARTQTSPTG